MKWKDLKVKHYQALYLILRDKSLSEVDRDVKIVSALYGLSEDEIDAMPMADYTKLVKKASFLYDKIPGRPKKFIRSHGLYKINYKVDQIPFGRYAEIKTFKGNNEEDIITNLHKITASIVKPLLRKYDASKHEKYADAMREARFIDVYHACVFFYHQFCALTLDLRDYLVHGMMKTQKMTKEQAQSQHTALLSDLAGFITQNSLPSMKVSVLKRLGTLKQYKHLMPSATQKQRTPLTETK